MPTAAPCHHQGQGGHIAPRPMELPPLQPQPALPQGRHSARARACSGFKLGPSQAAPGMVQPAACGLRCPGAQHYRYRYFLFPIPPPLPRWILLQEGSATSGLRPIHLCPQRQQGRQVEGGKQGQDPTLTAKTAAQCCSDVSCCGQKPTTSTKEGLGTGSLPACPLETT